MTSAVEFVTSGGGDDLLMAQPGVLGVGDIIDAGAGFDTLQLTSAGTLDITVPTTFLRFEALAGSSGDDLFIVDRARFSSFSAVSGGNGTDTIRFVHPTIDLSSITLTGVERIVGSEFDDTLTLVSGRFSGLTSIDLGDSGLDVVRLAGPGVFDLSQITFSGVERIFGSDGDDTVHLAGVLVGALPLDLRKGIDTIQVGSTGTLDFSNWSLFGVERLLGTAGNDVVRGNASNLGGIGTLAGGAGSDTLALTGSMSLIGQTLSGFETITTVPGGAYGFSAANLAGVTLLDGGSGSRFSDLDLSAVTADVTLNLRSPALNGVVGGTTIRGFNGGYIDGGSGDDSFTAGTVSFRFDGGAGRDRLDAGPGFGGSGVLNGEAGDDTLISTAALNGQSLSLNGGDGIDLAVVDRSGYGGNLTFQLSSISDGTILIGIESVAFTGGSGNDTLGGGAYGDTLVGGAGADTLRGLGGNDVLDGGAGIDTMTGGAGNDLYYVDNKADVVIETANGGTDTVRASVSFVLADFVQNLELLGTAALDGTGNDLDNVIRGNRGSNILQGKGGNDTLAGGAGADSLIGGNGIDVADYSSATGVVMSLDGSLAQTGDAAGDTLIGIEGLTGSLGGADRLRGNDAANVLSGLGGNDTLEGGLGNDILAGGAGRDALFGGAGIDTADYGASTGVRVSLDGSLVATGDAVGDGFSFVEGLRGSLTGADTLRGNAGDNTLTGNGGNDRLEGGDGNDVLVGGAGGDAMLGGAGVDVADYGASTGVVVSLDGTLVKTGDAIGDAFSLIESVSGSQIGADTLRGNAANNTLDGRGGNDRLEGGSGNDWLIGRAGFDTLLGEAGRDTFLFLDPIEANTFDTIVDYVVADDTIGLSSRYFAGVGQPGQMAAPDAFRIGTAAADITDRIIYNGTTGALFYDADGVGGQTQTQIAKLSAGLALTSADFMILL